MQTARIYSDDALTPWPLPAWFGNDHPVEVDLGCGKGRFLLAHAHDHPGINYLGIDRMLRRIRKVDRKVVRAGLRNVRLYRMEAYYAVTYLIPAASIATYFILFPDPWPKARHHHHRLFNDPFMAALRRTLQPGGRIHVATDHQPYFREITEIFARHSAWCQPVEPWAPAPHERTDFECLFMDKKAIGRASYLRS